VVNYLDWLIGPGGRKEDGARMPTLGSMHEQVAGDGDDEVCHRRHREGQAADKEGVVEGWANEQRRPPQWCRSR
jgi:hypothetical protein